MACKGFDCMSAITVVWGSLEIVLFGGVVFGWHNIVYIYKDLGYFSSHCPVANNATENDTAITFLHGVISNGTVRTHWNVSDYDDNTQELTCKERYELTALESQSGCTQQDEQFNIVFSLSTFINGILCFWNGFLYDRFGTRKSRFVSMCSVSIGLLFLIFASPDTSYLLYPGFIFLTYGGYMILMTNLQISGLVPKYRSMIMAAYCGSYDTSSTIFLFFKFAYENHGTSPNVCFTVLLVVYMLVFGFSTFFILPRDKIPWPRPSKYKFRPRIYRMLCKNEPDTEGNEGRSIPVLKEFKIDEFGSVILFDHNKMNGIDTSEVIPFNSDDVLIENSVINHSGETNIEKSKLLTTDASEISKTESRIIKSTVDQETVKGSATEIDNVKHGKKNGNVSLSQNQSVQNAFKSTNALMEANRVLTFKQIVLSPLYLFELFWISVHRLRSWMFIGVFNPWMSRLVCGDKETVSHFTSFLSSTMFISIFTAALSGCVMDRKVKKNYNNIHRFERMHASMATIFLNCTIGLSLSISMTIPVIKLQYITCVLFTLHRSFLYGPNSAFVAIAFPMEHFGKLVGITFTVSAVFGMLQYPLFLWIQGPLDKDPLVVNVIICVLIFCTFILPTYIWFYLRKLFPPKT